MQTPMQLTIRSLALTVVSVVVVLGINLVPAGDMQTFVLALDDDEANTRNIEYTGTPGETVKGQVVIMNPSVNPKKIQITLENLDDEDVRENGLAAAENLYECCQSWITLPQGEFYTIEPNQKSVIAYEMNIPQDAEAKNYYGAFVVKEINEDQSAENENAEINALNLKHHCNIVKLRIMHQFDRNLGMVGSYNGIYNAAEINLYSPVFAVLAALMLATGLALGVRWCIRKFKI